jgi:hypothetical protein
VTPYDVGIGWPSRGVVEQYESSQRSEQDFVDARMSEKPGGKENVEVNMAIDRIFDV